MAKLQKSISFSNAMIDKDSNRIYEMDKDGDIVGMHDLDAVLAMWDNEPGVSITIKKTNDVTPVSGGD